MNPCWCTVFVLLPPCSSVGKLGSFGVCRTLGRHMWTFCGAVQVFSCDRWNLVEKPPMLSWKQAGWHTWFIISRFLEPCGEVDGIWSWGTVWLFIAGYSAWGPWEWQYDQWSYLHHSAVILAFHLQMKMPVTCFLPYGPLATSCYSDGNVVDQWWFSTLTCMESNRLFTLVMTLISISIPPARPIP